MQYVIAVTPLNPLRALPAHRAEMVSQLLLGEVAELLDTNGAFSKIKTIFDQYEGWVQSSQLASIDEGALAYPIKGYSTRNATILINKRPATIYTGTPIKSVEAFGDLAVDYCDASAAANLRFTKPVFEDIVQPYLNTSYLWGGRSSAGIDCSGLTQQLFRFFDKKLPRDAYMQARVGDDVGFLEEAVLGDLAFFDNEEGRIIHVGILLDAGHILHASGNVRIDKIDAQGIVHVETGTRTHKLRIIKRIA